MRYYHRHSFFPLVIILLTIFLGVFIAITVSRDQVQTTESHIDTVVPVDAAAYRTDLVRLITTFETDMALATQTEAKSAAAEKAFASLLLLRVPPEDKQLHLNLALLFTRMQTTLKSDDPAIQALLLELQDLKQTL